MSCGERGSPAACRMTGLPVGRVDYPDSERLSSDTKNIPTTSMDFQSGGASSGVPPDKNHALANGGLRNGGLREIFGLGEIMGEPRKSLIPMLLDDLWKILMISQ